LGRKYSKKGYGNNTYDLGYNSDDIWFPIDESEPPLIIWNPATPGDGMWASAIDRPPCGGTDPWTAVPFNDGEWVSAANRPPCGGTEVWVPVTEPVLP
jgi:hypothetical protein